MFGWLKFSRFFPRKQTRRPISGRQRHKLARLEMDVLEDRTLLSGFVTGGG